MLAFLGTVLTLYKMFAFLFICLIAVSSIFLPVFLSVINDTPLPLALYLLTPVVLAICYKLLCLF